MTEYAEELKRIRGVLGLTQVEMARVLGVDSGNSVMRYERGFRDVPEPIIRLARQLVRMQAMMSNKA